MYEQQPNLFGVRAGADFPKALLAGIIERFGHLDPVPFSRIEIILNTRRMERRFKDLFDVGSPRLLPQIKVLSDVGAKEALLLDIETIPPLRRRMELLQLISSLLDQQPDLASRDSLFDLADSVAKLMDEMQGEGVDPSVLETLDVVDESGHWRRSLSFLKIAQGFFNHTDGMDSEAFQRLKVETVVKSWDTSPPSHPIIIAGSTGSRGTTALLMEAVAKLPNGFVVLPGFDFDQPAHVWDQFENGGMGQDHPQYRFSDLANRLDIDPTSIENWSSATDQSTARTQLMSLALRPAPVTDQWMIEGPKLRNLARATNDLTILNAQSPREEAVAIAMKLRACVETGETVALITPDRNLTRQITAALDQWNIVPDDSAGIPLPLTASGRFLLQNADMMGKDIRFEDLLALLKHPITNTGNNDRGPHLRMTREYELHTRRNGPPFPDGDTLVAWADTQTDDYASKWARWIAAGLEQFDCPHNADLSQFLRLHLASSAHFSQGPDGVGYGVLWQEKPGIEAHKLVSEFEAEADSGGIVTLRDYRSVLRSVLNKGEVRDRDTGHPNVLIWGTLEARVQGAETVILAGMNEGSWPENPTPDPWLNRRLRAQAGLLVPDRQIGLSAHDFQQAICAPKVWVTRSVRNSDAETVPSRWLNRMTNLLEGLPNIGGKETVKAMLERGDQWLLMARKLEAIENPTAPIERPSPIPPVSVRPRKLSVTRFKTLVRDPYAIYAEYILRLRPLDPIRVQADAPLRGIVMHRILERFIDEMPENDVYPKDRLLAIGEEEFAAQVPWPVAQRVWLSRLKSVADYFLATEAIRQKISTQSYLEIKGKLILADLDFTVTGTADRIDLDENGDAWVYDYKTGVVPTGPIQQHFDRQLLIEAAMIEDGAFPDAGARTVKSAQYLGLGSSPKETPAPFKDVPIGQVFSDLRDIIMSFDQADQGYTSRAKMQKDSDPSYFDHLARHGEWDATQSAKQWKLI
jgi:ATP-dependent helicase/nuclease subunit B